MNDARLRQLVAEAIDSGSAKAAGDVANLLRFALGMNYRQTLAFVQSVRPEVTAAQWEGLMNDADMIDGEGA